MHKKLSNAPVPCGHGKRIPSCIISETTLQVAKWGDMAVEMLHAAFKILIRDDGASILRRDYPEFNESLLFFLPKKATSTMPDGARPSKRGVSDHSMSPTVTT